LAEADVVADQIYVRQLAALLIQVAVVVAVDGTALGPLAQEVLEL
jgi:cystathionine beta-lyase/cystathionine gamma-synthase